MREITTKKRNTWIALVFFMFGAMVYAQEGFHKINIGADLALPMGDFSDISSAGFGVSGKVYYGIDSEMSLTGSIGYLHFTSKDFKDFEGGTYSFNVNMIPVMFGFDYDFGGFYVEPKLGLVFASNKSEGRYMGESYSATHSSTEFGVGLGGGYRYENFDFGLHYNIVKDLNYLGLRVAYNFGI